MKRIFTAAVLGLGLIQSQATLVTTNWTSGFANSGGIPNGNLAGWSDTRTLGGLSGNIADLNVTLNISGGWNGDLYAYLVHNSGFVVLLNRVGRDVGNSFGYSDAGFGTNGAGFDFKFDDQAAGTNAHYYQQQSYTLNANGQLTGTYSPDGRTNSPLASLAVFNSAIPQTYLGSFTNLDANGSWTLFVADVVGGGGGSTINNWGLEMDLIPVPEVSQWAMCGVMLAFGIGYFFHVRRQLGAAKISHDTDRS